MNAYYSEDLRTKKIVEAVERGMPKIEAARTFDDVGISSALRQRKDVPTLPLLERYPCSFDQDLQRPRRHGPEVADGGASKAKNRRTRP